MDRDKVEKLLGRQRDRVIASLLSFKEREVDPFLSEDVSRALRKAILDQVNDLSAFCADLLDDGVLWNDAYLNLLTDIHREVVGAD